MMPEARIRRPVGRDWLRSQVPPSPPWAPAASEAPLFLGVHGPRPPFGGRSPELRKRRSATPRRRLFRSLRRLEPAEQAEKVRRTWPKPKPRRLRPEPPRLRLGLAPRGQPRRRRSARLFCGFRVLGLSRGGDRALPRLKQKHPSLQQKGTLPMRHANMYGPPLLPSFPVGGISVLRRRLRRRRRVKCVGGSVLRRTHSLPYSSPRLITPPRFPGLHPA